MYRYHPRDCVCMGCQINPRFRGTSYDSSDPLTRSRLAQGSDPIADPNIIINSGGLGIDLVGDDLINKIGPGPAVGLDGSNNADSDTGCSSGDS